MQQVSNASNAQDQSGIGMNGKEMSGLPSYSQPTRWGREGFFVYNFFKNS
jgi:hypothetical protein